jgi:DNA-binding winged helix-turn-helix (wHTH) protein
MNVETRPADFASGVDRHYRFGACILDTRERTILVGADRKRISENLFRILLLLIRANGAPVTKDEFFANLWPDGVHTEGNIAQNVLLLRNVLADGRADRDYIVTVPGIGYRLGTPVEAKVGLRMKQRCDRCDASIDRDELAYICSYECTFCAQCAAGLSACPNCGGELVRRPRRLSQPQKVLT